jgi:hypothetical protein
MVGLKSTSIRPHPSLVPIRLLLRLGLDLHLYGP